MYVFYEGCYGISESQSVASTESSASTEPWFCDACKADIKPVCRLILYLKMTAFKKTIKS